MQKINREKMQIKVGAFVALGLAALLFVVFMLGSQSNYFSNEYILVARFDDISGLREGAGVQLAGVNMGTVDHITFDASLEEKKIRVFLKLKESLKNRIRQDSVAKIMTQGLLGDKMIHISVGTPSFEVLKENDELITKPSVDFATVTSKVDDLALKANETIESINSILGEIKDGEGVVHQFIYDPKGKEMMDSMASLAKNLDQSSDKIEGIMSKINQGQGTLGALVNDASVYNDVKTLLGKANRNKLVRAVIRQTLKTRDEELVSTPEESTPSNRRKP